MQSEEQQKKEWIKLDRISKTCGKSSSMPTYAPWESQKRRKGRGQKECLKNIWRNNDQNLPKVCFPMFTSQSTHTHTTLSPITLVRFWKWEKIICLRNQIQSYDSQFTPMNYMLNYFAEIKVIIIPMTFLWEKKWSSKIFMYILLHFVQDFLLICTGIIP